VYNSLFIFNSACTTGNDGYYLGSCSCTCEKTAECDIEYYCKKKYGQCDTGFDGSCSCSSSI
jgi:hypothetical protein